MNSVTKHKARDSYLSFQVSISFQEVRIILFVRAFKTNVITMHSVIRINHFLADKSIPLLRHGPYPVFLGK